MSVETAVAILTSVSRKIDTNTALGLLIQSSVKALLYVIKSNDSCKARWSRTMSRFCDQEANPEKYARY